MIHIDDHTSVVASPASWIEGEAQRQLRLTSALPGVRWAVGMPDLHPGKGHPIGAAVLSEGIIYPYLVGSDIGCGMALFATTVPVRKARVERWGKRLEGLDEPWEGDAVAWLEARGVREASFSSSLGTVGGGNHFAELQKVNAVMDAEAARTMGLDEEMLLLLVHSGSRGLGDAILRAQVARSGAGGIAVDSEEGRAYLEAHARAVAWARANRALIAERMASRLGLSLRPLLDVCHNAVWPHEGGYLHRKGAAPHGVGPVPIPGSRGTCTYFVAPEGDGKACGHSLAHGAGRKWTRTQARERMRDRYRADDLLRTPLGGVVVCGDRDLLFEEAPEAYKNIDRVIEDLVDAGACRVVARAQPVLTYKTGCG